MGIKGVLGHLQGKRLDPEGGEGQKVSHPNEETASSGGPDFPGSAVVSSQTNLQRV